MAVDRWSVWLANLDPVTGSEQGGKRPVLIVSDAAMNSLLPVVNILPITSRKPGRRIYPNEVFFPMGTAGLVADSLVLCYQIRTLDKQRLSRQLGVLNDAALQDEVIEAICFQLDIH